MYAGNIVEVARVEELFERPLHPYTQGLLEAIPSIEEKKELMSYIPGSVPNLIHPPDGCRFHPRCRYAREKCSMEIPELRNAYQSDEHRVACHYWEETYAARS
jgi:oligopeptide/dipeptide ABC transporter, ATP-binding protein, C-terminal domain